MPLTDQEVKEQFDSLKGTKRTPLVDWLAQPGIEGWRDNVYVPDGTRFYKEKGRYYNSSGPSIGNGIDMGQWSKEEFLKAGVKQYLVDRIDAAHAFKAKDMAAYAAAGQLQASIGFTQDEVNHIANKITAYGEERLRRNMPEGRYDSMTTNEQGVVNSLYHLYGPSFLGHDAFNQAVAGDWKALYNNMQSYSNKTTLHDSRNKRAAEYLRPSIATQTRNSAITTVAQQ